MSKVSSKKLTHVRDLNKHTHKYRPTYIYEMYVLNLEKKQEKTIQKIGVAKQI